MDDLAGFLRTRRSRVAPAAVGIPTDNRRRVKGLRREEVAHLSGVSVDYYVRLEQAVRPSPPSRSSTRSPAPSASTRPNAGTLTGSPGSAAGARRRRAGGYDRSCCASSTWSPRHPR
ncbi:helix-turn-helix domain-containing protein [Planotetraspora sp. A-T 1434]|nr:helix-turn-helix domain-containing protein [Planotetraspora sp. A-T 1434]MCT9934165.1 helix-turn-helix domain-containing protein [Planotetraspora sp. A-T 1434]